MESKKARGALGRGLSALISTPVSIVQTQTATSLTNNLAIERISDPIPDSAALKIVPPNTGVMFVPILNVVNNSTQPRQDFIQSEIDHLAESIKQYGILQPILTRAVSDGKYEIVAGERRWRAAQAAGLQNVPIVVRELSEQETLEIALVENIQRENLNPIEEAQGYQRLIVDFNLTQAEVAEKVGKERATIANAVRLLKLPEEIVEQVKNGSLSIGHAKAILSIREPSAQLSLARKAIKEGLSVRALEQIVERVVVLDLGKRQQTKDQTNNTGPSNQPDLASALFPAVIDRLRNALGTKVNIRHRRSGKGKIEIEYFSESELDRLVDKIAS